MSRTVEQRVADILEAIGRCHLYAAKLASAGGDESLILMAEDAMERNLQIIGEAVSHLPESVTAAHPEIPWPQIRGFRNVLVHQYFGVDADVIVDVVENHLPGLADVLQDL